MIEALTQLTKPERMMIYSEIYATGKYDVLYANDNGQCPRRIGHIIGGRRNWQAEMTMNHFIKPDLGDFKTKKAALLAIQYEFERPLSNAECEVWND